MTGSLRMAGIAAAFLVQAAMLAWLIVPRALTLANGTEIQLAVTPVDPHDFFRGDYVTLAYPVSLLRADQLEGDDDFSGGDTVFVTMRKDGEVWRPVALAHAPPPAGAIFLKGTVEPGACAKPCRSYRAEYGLEKFFVPEGEGRALERLRNDQKVSVDVAVAPSGEALLKRLRVDGEIRFAEPLF